MHYNVIKIDSQRFIKNLINIKLWCNQFKQKPLLCLPVKANAYGHGLIGLSNIAQPHIDYFGVSCLDEAIILRQNGITKPILVFGAFAIEQIGDLIYYNTQITVSSLYKATKLVEYCKQHNVACKIHIKIDTGMRRIGVKPENAKQLIEYVLSNECLQLIGVYSHFANSDFVDDKCTQEQIEIFTQIVSYIKTLNLPIICHIANSGGICNYPNSIFDMVRPGLLAYGFYPNNLINYSKQIEVIPILNLSSQVTYFKVVKKNMGISYNHNYTTLNDTRIVTISIGYGDGYRRDLSNIGTVLIRNKKYPIVGNICMDMLMVDLGLDGEAYVGDEVVLIGKQGVEEITATSIANICKTIVYEILCNLNDRIPRIYY